MTISTTVRTARAAAVLAALLISAPTAHAQSLSYTRGQNVAPAFEGWEQDPDGSKWFLFGYMNRNWVEEIDVPIGPDNSIMPGGPDAGQPTHFLPRRNRFVFRVPVPANFTEKDEMVWTLTAHGKTEKAYASLRPDYVLDNVAKMSETGALGAGTSNPELRSNQPPAVRIEGPKALTATVGQPLTLVAVVQDDGIPKPPTGGSLFGVLIGASTAPPPGSDAPGAAAGRGGAPAAGASAAAGGLPPALLTVLSGRGTPQDIAAAADALGVTESTLHTLINARRNPAMNPPARVTVGKVIGLHLSWFVYRGPGAVIFSPEQVKTWEDTRAGMNSPWAPLWTPPRLPADGRITVDATFTEPGTYVLRALADDGGLLGGENVTVTVRPAPPGAPPSTTGTAKPGPPAAAVTVSDVSGTWNIVLEVAGNPLPVTASLGQQGDAVSGTLTSPLGEMPVTGTLKGRTMMLQFTATTPQGPLPVTMSGEAAADGTFEGTAALGPLGEARWHASRAN